MKSRTIEDNITRLIRETERTWESHPCRNTDGGFGRALGEQSDSWSTAEAIMLAQRMGVGATPDTKRGVNYLLSIQNPDGGWGTRANVSDTTGSALALLALSPYGSKTSMRIVAEKGIEWLRISQASSGGWALIPGERGDIATIFTTVHACLAVLTWYQLGVGDAATVNMIVTLASHFITNARNADNSWGLATGSDSTTRHTGYVVLFSFQSHSLGSIADSISTIGSSRRAVKWIVTNQHADGAWGVHGQGNIESTSACTRALVASGRDVLSKEIRAAAASLISASSIERPAGASAFVKYSGPDGRYYFWNFFYATLCLLDLQQALDGRKVLRSRLVPWRKILLAILVVGLVAAIVTLFVVAPAGTASIVLKIGAALAAVATIVAAWPALKQIWFDLRSRRQW